jgi:peptide/nickel transport system substrate-binding protein
VQSNLQAVGINVTLAGSPTGTWLTDYRSGKMAFGLSLWGPDYPDPADYLTFAPGDLVGLRVGWPKGASAAVEKTAAAAAVATDAKKRTALFQQFQRQLNASGPYFPLMQPTQVFVATSDLKNAVYNSVYSIDVTKVAPK